MSRSVKIACAGLLLVVGCSPAPRTLESVIANQKTAFSVRCQPATRSGTPAGSASGVLLLNLHRDEWTSLDAAAEHPRGDLCWLEHPGGRNVYAAHDGERYRFDPNRMFTRAGLVQTLASLNEAPVPPEVVEAVAGQAERLVAATVLPSRTVVVALHNNTEGRYSAESYLPGAEYASDADTVYLAPGGDPDDFYFVTDQALFEALAGGPFAVVLQNNATVTDDGSLSVYCARHGIRYVNVEAQHGHGAEQRAMLARLYEALGSGQPPQRAR